MTFIFQYAFMQNAFIASFFIALLMPFIGTFLVLRRYSLIGDTLSHASFAGAALGILIGYNPVLSSFIFASMSGAIIEALRYYFKEHTDLILSIVMSFSVGLLITLISSGAVRVNAESYLFGSILTITRSDVFTVAGLSLASIIVLLGMYHKLVYIVLDEESAQVMGIRVRLINYIFSVLAAAAVATALKIVGMLTLTSMLALPVASALQFRQGFRNTVIISMVLSVLLIMSGLTFSFHLNVAPGGFTALLCVFLLLFIILAKALWLVIIAHSGKH